MTDFTHGLAVGVLACCCTLIAGACALDAWGRHRTARLADEFLGRMRERHGMETAGRVRR